MTIPLRSALREFLEDWKQDFAPEWRTLLQEVELDFEGVDEGLELHAWEPIFPSRRHFCLPGAPEGAHLFRAFDGLCPQDVRCLLVGQDPYPSISFSTGRSFEDGEHRRWSEMNNMRSNSMRSLIQSVYASRTGCADYAQSVDAWPQTLSAIEQKGNGFQPPANLAQSWVDQGVLLLNASLSLSRFSVEGHPHQTSGHLRLWRPLVAHLLRYYAGRVHGPVVFIFMGDAAQEAARAAGLTLPEEPRTDGPADTSIVLTPHPASGNEFLSGINPFAHSNQLLRSMDEPPIRW